MTKDELYHAYGHCYIRPGTILYHGTSNNEIKNCMFFGLTPIVPLAFHNAYQIWEVKEGFDIIFLCESVSWRSRTNSSIPQLFKQVFPEEWQSRYSDLDIKHFDIELRNRFTEKLCSDFGIFGWFSTLEGKFQLEVCLFRLKFIAAHLKLTSIKHKGEKYSYINGLRSIDVYPPEIFFAKSYHNLFATSTATSKKELWNNYRKFRNECIKEKPFSDDMKINREEYFDLRSKLKF